MGTRGLGAGGLFAKYARARHWARLDDLFMESRGMFQDRHSVRAGKVAANLNLQMMLYYHGMFDLLWVIANWVLHQHKFTSLPTMYAYEFYLNYLLYVVFILAEIPRLYLGCRGNL